MADDNSAGDATMRAQTATAEPGVGSLDKVRDILFGAQAREYEKRLVRLEERIVKESTDMRAEMRKRFDALEAYIKGEVETLGERLQAERRERTDSANALADGLKNLTHNFEQKTSQIDEQLARSQRELREQILNQSKNLSDEIQQKHTELSTSLTREADELRNDKTDRSALAAMFTELAMRLKNEFNLPSAEDLGNG
jgi:DNA anti-recombination protein RmuC